MNYSIRELKRDENKVLDTFLYEAIFIPEGVSAPPKYKQASLSVQKMNYAVRMYRKIGFEIIDENDEEYIMICKL